ncbi:MAG: FRG domain-containing protein [Methylomicrobium sp.]
MNELEADGSISSFIETLKKSDKNYADTNKETWFRGQPDYAHRLIPSVFRNIFNNDNPSYNQIEMYDEAGMYAEFVRRYPEHSHNHKNVFEWLTLMQHYHLPTRLLDWTTNLLVALFFCCNGEKDKDGAIFAFNPMADYSLPNGFGKFLEIQVTSYDHNIFYEQLVMLAENEFGENTKINGVKINDIKNDIGHKYSAINNPTRCFESFESWRTCHGISDYYDNIKEFYHVYTFRPPHLNQRIRQQHGCFTFHGGKFFEGRKFIMYEPMELQYSLVKIKVKREDKPKLLDELAMLGIYEATLFPEMEYQSKQIKDLYRMDYKLIKNTQILY